MKTYINNRIKGFYIEFPQEMDPEEWNGKLGSTYQDFIDGKWVLLSDEQVVYHENNPSASVKEVFSLGVLYTEESLEEALNNAKAKKLRELELYDHSSYVNGFTINDTVEAWFTPEERSNYKSSVDSAKLLGVDSLSLFISDQLFTITVDQAEKILAYIQLYADNCYLVTKKHKLAIKAIETLEEVESYDFTTGYPEKLNFGV